MEKIFSEVTLYQKNFNILDDDIKFIIIMSQYKWKWVFVQHKERETWEIPGWHRESWESVLNWAKRELFEETWAIEYEIEHIWYYSLVNLKWIKSYGSIFYSLISELSKIPDSEIWKIDFFDEIPKIVTYPNVHPLIYDMVIDYIETKYL